MREFTLYDMKKDAPPIDKRHISIPTFMLSPHQKKINRHKLERIDTLTSGMVLGGIIVAFTFALALEEATKASVIGIAIGVLVAAVGYAWRCRHDLD